MKRIFYLFFLFIFSSLFHGQQDSIYILAKVHDDLTKVDVQQNISLNVKKTTDKIELLNWVAAYQKRGTSLAQRMLENQNKSLHFAHKKELGALLHLKVKVQDSTFMVNENLDKEHIVVDFPHQLNANQSVKIELFYTIKLPSAKFTGFGKSKNEAFLKYFFLVPDTFHNKKNFQNIDETSNFGTHWKVNLEVPANYYSRSNLVEKMPHSFEGKLNENPEFLISKNKYPSIKIHFKTQLIDVDFGYPVSQTQLADLEFLLPLHLYFIKEKTGLLPSKIFISKPFLDKEDFFGNDDVKFWKFRIPMFSPQENTDLDYFSVMSKKVLQQSVVSDKERHHGVLNGIKTYLEIEYLKKNYPDKRLLGNLPEFSIFGMKPLKWFHASELKLIERYNIGYRYMMTRNLDQKINEDFSKFSNLNQLAISHFESGRILHYMSEKMGKEKFHQVLKNYFKNHQNKILDSQAFINDIHQASNGEFSFIKKMLDEKHRVNFNLKKAKINNDEVTIAIKHNLPKSVPFPLESTDETGKKEIRWLSTKSENGTDAYTIPNNNIRKLVVNNSMYLPEKKDRDNYRYTKGLFSNFRKVKFRIFNDIENPEYHEIYLNPRFSFNVYDKVLLGLNFSNRSFLDKKFNYSLTPYFSTGTGKITGSGALKYRIMPADNWFQKITLGVSGAYFHYDYDNAYRKASIFSNFLFRKRPRSSVSNRMYFSFNHYQKDLPTNVNRETNYDQYNLVNMGYTFSNPQLIHEKFFNINFQTMGDFQKVSTEIFYRYEFLRNRKLSVRWFGGYFFNNKTKNNIFDFGISKVSNYAFNYGLLGQSVTSGLLSQQFILADGGFKSYLGNTANQWVTSFNVDTAVWQMFHLYADAGWYKNKGKSSQFIWDSGVKVRVIPDFLEIYFPMYSTLGFEPKFKDYGKRIRFTFVFNFGRIASVLRRGWY